MKKTSSVVWRFFDRLEENKRCVAVLCKLCDSQYKYFGNTTNLRTHLVNKHPIQWDLLQNGTLDESTFRAFDDDENTNQSTVTPKRKRYSIKTYKDNNVRYSVSLDLNNRGNSRNPSAENSMPVIEIQRVDVLENSETDNEHLTEVVEEPISIVRQMHGTRNSDEEWLNEEMYETVDYQPKRKKMKYRTIKREVQTPPPNSPKYRVVKNSVTYPKPERVIIDNSSKKDEYSIFGEYVGNRMRKFRNPQIRGNVQQLITTILWQAEYGMYDNIETVKRVLLHSVQDMEVEQPGSVEQIIVQEESPIKECTDIDENN